MWSNLLLSGPPRVGKTTLVQKAIEKLPPRVKAAGFYTEEIKEGGIRKGFKVVNLDEKETVFAHHSFSTSRRVGKYGVDVAKFENAAVAPLEEALSQGKAQIVVIDEIGKMELFSRKFRDMLLRALEGPQIVLATIGIQQDSFTQSIRSRADTKIFEVSKGNRDELPETILRLLLTSFNQSAISGGK